MIRGSGLLLYSHLPLGELGIKKTVEIALLSPVASSVPLGWNAQVETRLCHKYSTLGNSKGHRAVGSQGV